MPKWLTNLVMLCVLLAWATFMGLAFARDIDPPIPYWTVPGATYLVLRSRLNSVTFGPFGAEAHLRSEEEKERHRKEVDDGVQD